MSRFLNRLAAAVVFSALLSAGGCRPDSRDEVVVFAASSLRDVLREMSGRFEREAGFRPVFNFAGSNVLAQQIEASSVADVYLSADESWMDYLQGRGLLLDSSRRAFLSNRLVLVGHADSAFRIRQPADLARISFRFLSLGDPRAVPAGRYAKAFLQNVEVGGSTLWRLLEGRVAPAPDVRAALGLVEARADTVGIVYATDVSGSTAVRILFTVPAELHPEIRYSAALIRNSANPRGGAAFLDFLGDRGVLTLFEQHGFLIAGGGKGGEHNP